jgi:hypothetical protein
MFHLARTMNRAEVAAAGVVWMSGVTADAVAARYKATARRLMAIDGFMGSGKSPFGSMMEARLGTPCIRIDAYLPANPSSEIPGYIDRLDLSRLHDDLQARIASGYAVIEGVLVRALLERLNAVRPADVFHVYVAGACEPDDQRVTWPDAAQLESQQSGDLYRQIVHYHQTRLPHAAFDVAVLRNQNEPEATGTFIAPDGQIFSISETVCARSQLATLRRHRTSFKCTQFNAPLEPLGLLRPPLLSASTRSLNDDRLRNVLTGIRTDVALPPVPIIREEGEPIATLLDGAHRYFASVAAGCTHIPAVHVSRDDAKLSYRYEPRLH